MSRSILSDMDWDDGIAIPISNDENKKLEDELIALQTELDDLNAEVNDNEEHTQNMTQHSKTVQRELNNILSLHHALTKDLETENRMYSIGLREENRLNVDIFNFEKQLQILQEKKNKCENKIFIQTQKVEELKVIMDWDQEALEAWLEESARKDDDYLTLKRYSREDNSKLKQLTMFIEDLMREAQQKRKQLDQEMLETLTAQIELDRVAEDFRTTHKERKHLISLWESTIEQIRKRDIDMDETADTLTRVKMGSVEQEHLMKVKRGFLQNEIENNREMNRNISKQERAAAKLRNDLQYEQEKQTQIQNELDSLRYAVVKKSTDVDVVRATIKTLSSRCERLEANEQQWKDRKLELADKMEKSKDAARLSNERAKMATLMLADEQQQLRDLKKIIARMREFNFRKNEELFKQLTSEKSVAANIQGNRATIRNLGSRLRKLNEHAMKQQEIVYNQEFTVQQLEMRISRLTGDINAAERVALETKISELVEALEKKRANKVLLDNQLQRLQDDIRRMKRQMEKIGSEQEEWKEKIKALELNITLGQKAHHDVLKKKHNCMVEENILKLHIKRIQDDVHRSAEEVLSLEKRSIQLGVALQERKAEVATYRESLYQVLKETEGEKTTIGRELQEREDRIKTLRAKYEILMIPMQPPEGEERYSQAYYVIKAAQEREELHRKGDGLDFNITRAIKEIKAMENTLKVLNSRNAKMRFSLGKVPKTSEEYELESNLNEQLHYARDKYKYKRRQLREMQDDVQAMTCAVDALVHEENLNLQKADVYRTKLVQLKLEIQEQKEKLERAYKQYFRVARSARYTRGQRDPLDEERDIDLRVLVSQNRDMSRMIAEAAHLHSDVVEAVESYFREVGLPPPSLTVFRCGSSSASSLPSTPGSGSSNASSKQSLRSSPIKSPIESKTVDLGFGLQITSSGRLGSRPMSPASSHTSSNGSSSRASSASAKTAPNC